MKHNSGLSQSAPTIRAQTAPEGFRRNSLKNKFGLRAGGVQSKCSVPTSWQNKTLLPALWDSQSPSPGSQRGGGSAPSGEYGLLSRRSNSDAMLLKSLRHQASVRSSSPPRPGSTGSLSGTLRAQTPYLLCGVTDAVESMNYRGERMEWTMHRQEVLSVEGDFAGSSEDAKHDAAHNEKEFMEDTDFLEKKMRDLHRQLENFDPLNSNAGMKNKKKKRADDDDEDEEDNMREKLEAYKMVRKIEPELPPLVALPPLSSSLRLPDNPMMEYNLSLEALEKGSIEFKKDVNMKRKAYREKEMQHVNTRRENENIASAARHKMKIDRKMQQAKDVLASRRDGGSSNATANQSFPVEVVAEKWMLVYAMAAFLRHAHEEVAFHRKSPEDRLAVLEARKAEGKERRTDEFHMKTIKLDECMQDATLISRLEMMAAMFQTKQRVADKRSQAALSTLCLHKWMPRAQVFLSFKKYLTRIKYLQGWWRRQRIALREIREIVSKRWEKLERFGTSGYHAEVPVALLQADPLDTAARMAFLAHELRSRRFFGLSQIALWEEDSAKWKSLGRAARGERGYQSMAPIRPSYMPADHIPQESQKKPCRDGCLGRHGDNEIFAMIKAARNNPYGMRPIPQKQNEAASKTKKASSSDDEKPSDLGPTAAARLFGEAAADDLERWGVHPSAMPPIGQKPGADQEMGGYP